MANKLVGRTYIINSAMNADVPILGPGTASWLDDAMINAIHFWGSDTTAKLELVYASNTADSFCILAVQNNAISGGTETLHFSSPQQTQELRIKTLTAGTAWIYLT